MPPRVLSVGQCSPDHGVLTRFLSEHYDADVVSAGTEADAVRQLEQGAYHLILVNRRLDEDGADGVAVIRRLLDSVKCPLMLVSNYADAQSKAVAAGAVPGFGKSQYQDPGVRDQLSRILGETVDSR